MTKTITDRGGGTAIGRAQSALTFDKVLRMFSTAAGRDIRTELPQSAAAAQVDDETTLWAAQITRGLYETIGQRARVTPRSRADDALRVGPRPGRDTRAVGRLCPQIVRPSPRRPDRHRRQDGRERDAAAGR